MIRRNGSYKTEQRVAMRGGEGSVQVEQLWNPETELKSATRLFARLTLKPGSSIGFHRHDGEEEIFVVLQGKAEADDNGETVTLLPGDTILTGNAGHAIKSVGADDLVLMAVIATHKG